jgi:GntR family transcriptional regulator, galactonate operon transcriptional repressor
MTPRNLPPRATFQEQVLEQIGRDICAGRYRPGQVLPSEGELCERFGFSRIVIREAIKSLVAKGMLEVSRRVGTLVLDPGRWNLFDPDVILWRADSAAIDPTMSRDLMELRRIVEPAAVRLAAARASEGERRALRTAYMAMERAVAGKGDYVEADLAFHTTILSACGNQFVRQMQEALSAMLRTSFEIVSQKPGGPRHSLPMHEAVCAAIERGDAVAAERAAITLIEHAEQDLKEQLATRKSLKSLKSRARPAPKPTARRTPALAAR